jgi:hypothetical protein
VASGAFIGINHEHFGQWILLLTSSIYGRCPPGAVASESTQVRRGNGSELTQNRPRAVDYELSNQGSQSSHGEKPVKLYNYDINNSSLFTLVCNF